MTTPEQEDNPSPELEQPFVAHLMELRDRLLRAVITVLVVFICLFPLANQIYGFVAEPLMAHLPDGSNMIAIEVASPFLTPFKLALVAAIFISVPMILYQLWAFVAPGLYQNEQRLVLPLLISSSLLFYGGVAFAYFIVFPLVFGFLTGVAPEGVAMMTDINRYLDFVLTIFFAFGIAFEVPIATVLLVWTGATTRASLRAKRPYIIVGAFVVGMLLTPPDVISQTLLALPMWVLFELGIIFSALYVRNPGDADFEAEETDDDEVDASEDFDVFDDDEIRAEQSSSTKTATEQLAGSGESSALDAELDELADDGGSGDDKPPD